MRRPPFLTGRMSLLIPRKVPLAMGPLQALPGIGDLEFTTSSFSVGQIIANVAECLHVPVLF